MRGKTKPRSEQLSILKVAKCGSDVSRRFKSNMCETVTDDKESVRKLMSVEHASVIVSCATLDMQKCVRACGNMEC